MDWDIKALVKIWEHGFGGVAYRTKTNMAADSTALGMQLDPCVMAPRPRMNSIDRVWIDPACS